MCQEASMIFKYSEPIPTNTWPNRNLYFIVGYHPDTQKWAIITSLLYHPDSKEFKTKVRYRRETGWTHLQVMRLPKMGGAKVCHDV